MDKTLGNKLNDLMAERKLTGKQLAADIGVTEGTISKILTGLNTNPKSDTIIALSKYFNVSTDYLLGLSDYKTAETADIGAVTGLEEENINALKDYVNYFKNKLENNTQGEVHDQAIYQYKFEFFGILNRFIAGLLSNNIINRMQECRLNLASGYILSDLDSSLDYDSVIKQTDMQLNFSAYVLSGLENGPNNHIPMIAHIIQGDNQHKECEKDISLLLDECTNYCPGKIEKIIGQFLSNTGGGTYGNSTKEG